MWMYENWIADQNDNIELAKNHAYLLGSFWNPEAVKQLIGGDNVHESTDEEFEESFRMVRESNEKELKNNKRKRRRRLLKE